MINRIQSVNAAPAFTSHVSMSRAVAKTLAGNSDEEAITAAEQVDALRYNRNDDKVEITVKTVPGERKDVRVTVYEEGCKKQATWNTTSPYNGYSYDLREIYNIAKTQTVPEGSDCWVTTESIPYDPMVDTIWLGNTTERY